MKLSDSPFYLLEEPKRNKCVCDSAPESEDKYEKIICPLVKGHQRAGRRLTPLNVEIPCSPAPDFLFTMLSKFIVQERAIAILQEAGLTGFGVSPAEARLRKTGEHVAVSQFRVQGWGGQVSEDSGVKMDERCPACGWLHYSALTNSEALIDTLNCDGSDFFIIWPLPKFIFVTQRVVDVFRQHRFTGTRFVKEFPKTSGSGFSGGRLSYWMSEEQAHALGDPLAIF